MTALERTLTTQGGGACAKRPTCVRQKAATDFLDVCSKFFAWSSWPADEDEILVE